MIEGILIGLTTALTFQNIFMVMIGCFFGTIIGMLPGLGPMTAIALMIPITYGFDPATGLILMAGVYYGAVFGGSTSSILLNAPGVPGTVATSFDGYPMAQQGKAVKALAIAAWSSFAGGTLAAIYLGYAGLFFSGLKLILPYPNTIKVEHKTLEYKKTGILVLIAIIYGVTILKVGYFLTTSFFLMGSYYFLGERRWILMFMLSFPFVAAFMYLLHGVLDIYLRDPFLKLIGVTG